MCWKMPFFIVDAHTETYGTVRGKKRLKIHRYFIMHEGDMHTTKVLILPSEVPRGANMLSESGMCYIFTNLGIIMCFAYIYTMLKMGQYNVVLHLVLYLFTYTHPHTESCKYILHILPKSKY